MARQVRPVLGRRLPADDGTLHRRDVRQLRTHGGHQRGGRRSRRHGGVALVRRALEESKAVRLAAREDGAPYTRESARQEVAAGDVAAYLSSRPGTAGRAPAVLGRPGPTIEVGIDPARRAEAGYLQGLVTKAAFERMRLVFEDPATMAGEVRQQIADVEAAVGAAGRARAVARLPTLPRVVHLDEGRGSARRGTARRAEPVRVEVSVLRDGRRRHRSRSRSRRR